MITEEALGFEIVQLVQIPYHVHCFENNTSPEKNYKMWSVVPSPSINEQNIHTLSPCSAIHGELAPTVPTSGFDFVLVQGHD